MALAIRYCACAFGLGFASRPQVLPAYLSKWSTEKVQNEGVIVVPNTRLVGVKKAAEGTGLELELESGQTLAADEVVVAVGIEPSIELAKKVRCVVGKFEPQFEP